MAETRFYTLLRSKIAEAIQNQATSLASGVATDYSQYKFGVGYIEGLNAALKLCDDVEREFN